MPYKTGKMKGELTTPEIRKLIKAHNVLVSIKIPKGAKREDIIALVEKNGYKVNHEKQALVPKVEMQRKKTIGLKKAQEITKPKPLTEEEKKKRQQAKQKREGEKAFLKTVIPKPPPVSKPSKGVKVGKPPPKPKKEEPKIDKKLYEKEYNEFLKMFNEAKERRSRSPFLELRDRIMRFTEPILVGTASFKVQDGARLKALKEPFMKKIQDILDKVDIQIKKYVEIGRKTVGGQQTRPKKEIKISNKPALNTKKIEPKKKEEPTENQRDKLNKEFIESKNILDPKLRELFNEKGANDPAFKKLYKKKLNAIAEYRSKSGGQSKTTELKKMQTPWLKAWVEGDAAFKKFLSRYKTYPLTNNKDNFIKYLKSI